MCVCVCLCDGVCVCMFVRESLYVRVCVLPIKNIQICFDRRKLHHDQIINSIVLSWNGIFQSNSIREIGLNFNYSRHHQYGHDIFMYASQ